MNYNNINIIVKRKRYVATFRYWIRYLKWYLNWGNTKEHYTDSDKDRILYVKYIWVGIERTSCDAEANNFGTASNRLLKSSSFRNYFVSFSKILNVTLLSWLIESRTNRNSSDSLSIFRNWKTLFIFFNSFSEIWEQWIDFNYF